MLLWWGEGNLKWNIEDFFIMLFLVYDSCYIFFVCDLLVVKVYFVYKLGLVCFFFVFCI